jgi:hypothetical protein
MNHTHHQEQNKCCSKCKCTVCGPNFNPNCLHCADLKCPCHSTTHEQEGDWNEFDRRFGRVTLYFHADGADIPYANEIKQFIRENFISHKEVGEFLEMSALGYRSRKRETSFQDTLFNHAANILDELREHLLNPLPTKEWLWKRNQKNSKYGKRSIAKNTVRAIAASPITNKPLKIMYESRKFPTARTIIAWRRTTIGGT